MMDKKGVIVLGGHVQALGICRILGSEAIPIVVIDETKYNLARHSRYCDRFFNFCNNQLLEKLLSMPFTSTYRDWLIMPTNDHHVKLLSENKAELAKFYKVGADVWQTVRLFYHKSLSYPIVKGLGIPLPQTIYFESYEEAEKLSADLMYPVIIKPSIMIQFYFEFRKKVIVCDTRDVLLTMLCKVLAKFEAHDVLIQEIIPGDPKNQYSVGLLSRAGDVLNKITVRRARQHPIDFGNATTFAHTVNVPIIEDYARQIMHNTQYNGVAEIEFKFDARDGQYKFLEVNPRTWKWHTIAKAAGCNLLRNYYNLIYGRNLTECVTNDASWTHSILDIPIRAQMRLKGMEIIAQSQNNAMATISLDDPVPALYELLYFPLNAIKRG